MTAPRRSFVSALWLILVAVVLLAPAFVLPPGTPWPVVGVIYLGLLMLGTLVTLALAGGGV